MQTSYADPASTRAAASPLAIGVYHAQRLGTSCSRARNGSIVECGFEAYMCTSCGAPPFGQLMGLQTVAGKRWHLAVGCQGYRRAQQRLQNENSLPEDSEMEERAVLGRARTWLSLVKRGCRVKGSEGLQGALLACGQRCAGARKDACGEVAQPAGIYLACMHPVASRMLANARSPQPRSLRAELTHGALPYRSL